MYLSDGMKKITLSTEVIKSSLLIHISFLFSWHTKVKQLIKSISLSCLKLLLDVTGEFIASRNSLHFLNCFCILCVQIVKLFACGRLVSLPAALWSLAVLPQHVTTFSTAYWNLATEQEHLPKTTTKHAKPLSQSLNKIYSLSLTAKANNSVASIHCALAAFTAQFWQAKCLF